MTRCCMDDGPCNGCRYCKDEDEADVTADDTDTNPFVQLRMDDERETK